MASPHETRLQRMEMLLALAEASLAEQDPSITDDAPFTKDVRWLISEYRRLSGVLS